MLRWMCSNNQLFEDLIRVGKPYISLLFCQKFPQFLLAVNSRMKSAKLFYSTPSKTLRTDNVQDFTCNPGRKKHGLTIWRFLKNGKGKFQKIICKFEQIFLIICNRFDAKTCSCSCKIPIMKHYHEIYTGSTIYSKVIVKTLHDSKLTMTLTAREE